MYSKDSRCFTGKWSAGMWVVFFAALSCFLSLPIVDCFATNTVAQYGGTYGSWPLDSQWQAINSLNDPVDLTQATWGHIDFVGDTTNPAVYTYYNGSYLFYRVRVHYAGDCTTAYGSPFTNGTIMVVISTNTTSPTPAYAFSWDFKENTHSDHGLEMSVIATTGVTWAATNMNDVDGNNAKKIAPPDFALTGGDGYIRTLDHQATTNFGDTLFVDFAISCDYLENRSTTSLRCNQTWKVTAASVQNANDHGFLNGDIAGGVNPPAAPTTGWSGPIIPTLAVFNDFQAYAANGTTMLTWETSSEVGTAGFNVYAVDPQTGKRRKVNASLIPALLESPQGGKYFIEDTEANQEEALTYLLEEVGMDGSTRVHGSCQVSSDNPAVALSGMDPGTISNGHPYKRMPHAREAPRVMTALPQAAACDSTTQRVKIGVRASGLHRVTAGEIASAMCISDTDARNLISTRQLRLSNQGKPVGILASSDKSALYFYGQALDTRYTDTNVYWLSRGAATIMPSIRLTAPKGTPGSAFTDSLHVEKDLLAWPRGVSDPEDDFWLWDYIYAGDPGLGTRNFVIPVEGATGSGQLKVHFRGLTDVVSGQNHSVRVTLNGDALGEDAWDGLDWHQSTFQILPGKLVDGNNSVEVAAVLNEGVPYSLVGVDSFDLTYERQYQAASDQLLARGDHNKAVLIKGFSSPQIWLFDLSKPRTPSLVANSVTGGDPGAGWVSFRPAEPKRLYLAATADGALTPAFIIPVANKSLKLERRANYLIITAPELIQSASSLAAFQTGRGLKPLVATTDEIYNDFSQGIRDPHAIHAFIKFAATRWRQALQFVVFAGDGSYDYKNSVGFNDSLVPPLMIPTPWGLTPSDGLMVDVAGDDGIPDIAFGRIPARTDGELNDYIDKLKTNTNVIPKAVFLADNPDSGGDFSADSNDTITHVAPRYNVEKIYLSQLTLDKVRSRLAEELNDGAFFLNYFGHASYDRLASEGILTKEDIPGLENGHKLPVVLGMTCLIGQFGLPGFVTLGETLVQQQGRGAIAVIGPTGPAANDDSKLLSAELWDKISGAGSNGSTLGKIILMALQDYASQGGVPYVVQSYTLLGDPAIEVK
jgi:hypothetical protein